MRALFKWTEKPDERLDLGNDQLEYACFGPPPSDAPTLVLLHEGLGCAKLWRDLPQRLTEATNCGVFVYSRAGYGASSSVDLPRPLTYMTREAELTLPVLLDHIGFKDGFLVGHSDGATIAAIYAGSARDARLDGVILMAPHFFAEEEGLTEITAAKEQYERGDLKTRLAKYHREPDVAFYGWCDSWLHPDFRQWNVADYLNAIDIPVMALQGRDDRYGTLRQIEEVMHRAKGLAHLVVLDNCGHAPYYDQADLTLCHITRFIEDSRRVS